MLLHKNLLFHADFAIKSIYFPLIGTEIVIEDNIIKINILPWLSPLLGTKMHACPYKSA